jgi:hypothetical protein
MNASSVALRLRNGEDMGAVQIDEFISRAKMVIETKATDKL